MRLEDALRASSESFGSYNTKIWNVRYMAHRAIMEIVDSYNRHRVGDAADIAGLNSFDSPVHAYINLLLTSATA